MTSKAESIKAAVELASVIHDFAKQLKIENPKDFIRGFQAGITNSLVFPPTDPTAQWEYHFGRDMALSLRVRPGHEIG